MTISQATSLIKKKTVELGFSACGIAKAEPVGTEVVAHQEEWLSRGYAAGMDYMHRNKDLRYNPQELLPGVKSLIVVAMNYYPEQIQSSDISFAYYSYGKDYHYVIKSQLSLLFKYIEEEINPSLNPGRVLEGRPFTDSAPIMERYWASKSGVGFQGRNQLIIVPHVGSFCFLGILALNIELQYDKPLSISCGKCHRCEESCPTHAISCGFVNANKCISYQTIENKSPEIPEEVSSLLGNQIFGCDICQKSCPWNRFAKPTEVADFKPSEDFLKIDSNTIKQMSGGDFKRMFKNSAISRAGLKGLLRNLDMVKKAKNSTKKR